ncbi:MAG: hypothetical protein OEL87_03665 [Nanoarchaeota archaeon]|nr:hypothetical protein [Nanoarchaeota archaeon]
MVSDIDVRKIPGALYLPGKGNMILDCSTLRGSMETLDFYRDFRKASEIELDNTYRSMTVYPIGIRSVGEVFLTMYEDGLRELADIAEAEFKLLETIAEQELEQIRVCRLQELHENYGVRRSLSVDEFEERWFGATGKAEFDDAVIIKK